MDHQPASRQRFAFVTTVVVAVVAFGLAIAFYRAMSPPPPGIPGFAYVELYVLPIGLLAVVDLVRRQPLGGAVYRAALAAVGLLSLLKYRDGVEMNARLAVTLVLYVALIAVAVRVWLGTRRAAAA
jgi:hypothetical protein